MIVWTLVACCTLICWLGFPTTAHAYVDPGTGSVLLQGIAFVFLMAGMFFRRIQGLINKYIWRGNRGRSKP
jgi:hypothetical protein